MHNRTFGVSRLPLAVVPLAGFRFGPSRGAPGQAVTAQPSTNQPSTRNGEWPQYTADLKGAKYSPLDQINASNFNKLEVAWRFKTDSLGPRPEYKLEGTPIMIKGVLYSTAGVRRSDR